MTNWTPMPYERLLAFQAAKELLTLVREAKIADAHLRDQALRAAKSACLNIAEAAGRWTAADQKRVFGIARGEAMEAAAAMEIAAVSHTTPPHAAASHRPTAATRSMTAKKIVAACHAVELVSKTELACSPKPTTTAQ